MNYYIAVRKYTVCGMNGVNKNTQLDKGRENKIDSYKKWDLFKKKKSDLPLEYFIQRGHNKGQKQCGPKRSRR